MIKNEFFEALGSKLASCRKDNFGLENTHGYKKIALQSNYFLQSLKGEIKNLRNRLVIRQRYAESFSKVYQKLDSESRRLLVELLAYRILGYRKVALSVNTPLYWDQFSSIERMRVQQENESSKLFSGLKRFELHPLGYDIVMDYTADGIMMDFVLEQYAHKQHGKIVIAAQPGDVVLDVGGCWGDTALYFAHKVGSNGMVYSFEFIPRNILVHNINTQLNPVLDSRIQLVPNPVFDRSDQVVYFQDKGPGSKVKMSPFKEQTGLTKTVSIDDFVKNNNVNKVDFIKMDIEGAEPFALRGAINTIMKFRPKLAIAVYHSIDDFANIPNWILDLDLGYEINLGHYTIYEDETICFASVK